MQSLSYSLLWYVLRHYTYKSYVSIFIHASISVITNKFTTVKTSPVNTKLLMATGDLLFAIFKLTAHSIQCFCFNHSSMFLERILKYCIHWWLERGMQIQTMLSVVLIYLFGCAIPKVAYTSRKTSAMTHFVWTVLICIAYCTH